jgi:hypothetical protein
LQEEVENRTVNLAVSTTKLTARTLLRALRWYLMHRSQKRLRKQMKHPFKEGKQSVDELIKAGVSTDKIELPDGSAKDFCKTAKKFGVDYAIRKDKTLDPPRYIVFFKAKDTEVLDQVVKEYVAVNEKKQEKKSIREQLRKEKEAAKAETKEKSKNKAKKIKKRKERTEGR